MVVLPFQAEQPRELTITPGDIIEMAHHPSGLTGWAIGLNKNTGDHGCYPMHFVEEIKDEEKVVDDVWYSPQNQVYLWGNNVNFTLGNSLEIFYRNGNSCSRKPFLRSKTISQKVYSQNNVFFQEITNINAVNARQCNVIRIQIDQFQTP